LLALVAFGGAIGATTLPARPASAFSTPLTGGTPGAPDRSLAVWHVCAGALLFDHAHDMGTRAEALAVARDIRASTARRLRRGTALHVPPRLRRLSSRWILSQRRLAASFARTWVRIYDAIDAARTPAQRATLPQRLHYLVHVPDPLRLTAGRVELQLRVPDCTGDG